MRYRRTAAATAALAIAFGAAIALTTADAGTEVPLQTDGKAPAVQLDPALVARGKYLTDMGDCEGCHNANGGRKLAGGQYMGMPFGQISTPNITADIDTGIGKYSDKDFIRLMHHGIRPNGQYIYPAMPYPWYATVPDDDVLAIKAYLFSVPPVHAPRRPNHIWFPFTIRPAIALWDAFFVPDQIFKPDPQKTAAQNRGAYIVGGLEHCGECHNNRNFLGNTKVALNLLGGPITKWYAPNLNNDKMTGIGGYSDDDLYSFFKNGHSPQMGTVAGPMSEVVDVSMMKLTDDDIHAVIAHLRTLPDWASYQARTGIRQSADYRAGEQVYLARCSSCHQVDGKGVALKIPALDGNGMVRARGSQDMIRVVIGGLEARGPYAPMPGVGGTMTDGEIALAVNYARQAWSNVAPANATRVLVHGIRGDTATLMDGKRGDGCPDLAQPELKAILADDGNGVSGLLHDMNLGNMLTQTNAIIHKVKALAPDLQQADIVNGLMVAYCPIAAGDKNVSASDRTWWITHFGERVYVQLTTNGSY